MAYALVIDDNKTDLQVMQTMFKQAGIRYTLINDSRQLEAALPGLEAVDIILVDLEMPGLDGFDVLALLRSHPLGQGAPIVACTVNSYAINDAQAAGFDSFISKPLHPARFPQLVNAILSGQAVWDLP